MFTVLTKTGEPKGSAMINCGIKIGCPDAVLLKVLPVEEKIRRYKSN